MDIPEYMTCIVDELNEPVCWCKNYTEEQIEQMLDEHPEWSRSTVRVTSSFM
jgi:hypothetical protein